MKYESPITYHSKDMANVRVFADRQSNRQAKNYMPLIYRYGRVKRCSKYFSHIKTSEFLKSVSNVRLSNKKNA
jgi:hypothetical protein